MNILQYVWPIWGPNATLGDYLMGIGAVIGSIGIGLYFYQKIKEHFDE